MFDRLNRRRTLLIAGLVFTMYYLSQLTVDNYIIDADTVSWDFTGYSFGGMRGSSSQLVGSDEEFRHQLANVRPMDTAKHSRTLGIADGIYVVSLARRGDRRAHMDAIAQALDLDFTYVNATDFGSPGYGKELVDNLIERVKWQRSRIDERPATEKDFPEPDTESSDVHNYHAFPFKWADDAIKYADNPLSAPLGVCGADYWDLDPPNPEWEAEHQLPLLSQEEKEQKVMTASVENNVFKNEPLTKAMVSCWHSHILALRQIVKNRDRVGIVFEDDIDIEWDVERMLRMQWPALPEKWDIVYLGHCWSEEYRGTPIRGAPMLHETFHTLCTHGYAVSLSGATKILRFLRSPDYAYGRPIDHALKDLIQMHRLKSWSVYPPVVVQTKEDVSDIVNGFDRAWIEKSHEALVDSTLERIALVRNASLHAMESASSKQIRRVAISREEE